MVWIICLSGSALLRKPMHQHVHDVGLRIKTEIKNVLQNHGLGHDAVGVAQQIFQQRKFARLQFNRLAAAPHLARQQVQGQFAGGQLHRPGGLRCPPDERLNARQQFGKGKRLGQIIIAAGLQPLDAVVHRGAGAQDEHGHPDVAGAQLPDEAQAVEFGQHEVHDRRVIGNGLGQGKRPFAVGAVIHGKAILLQALDDKRGDFLVILYNQYSHVFTHDAVFKLWLQFQIALWFRR